MSAVCGSGLVENAVLVIAEVDSIRSQAGVQVVHETGCEVTAKLRCSVEQDRGLVLLRKLAESLLVGSCGILGKRLVLRDYYLVRAACDKLRGKPGDVRAQQDGSDVLAVVSLKLLSLGKQLEHNGLYGSVLMLGKYPDAAELFVFHVCLLFSDKALVF